MSGDKKTEVKLKKLEANEAHKFVTDEYSAFMDRMNDKLKDIDGKQRWLLFGRIANVIYHHFYQMTWNAEKKYKEENESSL